MRNILILFDSFLPQWNYSIYPEYMREGIQNLINEQWKEIDELEKMKKKKKQKQKRTKEKEGKK